MKYSRISKFSSVVVALVMVLSMSLPFPALASELQKFPSDSLDEGTLAMKAAIAEQTAISEGGPRLHNDLQKVSGDEDVSVIVHLSEKPVALEQGIQQLSGRTLSKAATRAIEKNVVSQQEQVITDLEENSVDISPVHSYTTVLNGFSATVKADDLSDLLEIDGVTLVEPDEMVYASEANLSEDMEVVNEDGEVINSTATNMDFLGIERLWNEGYEGQGIKVAVLDTGIDANHPEFAGIYKGGKNFVTHDSKYSKQRASDDASETMPSERANGVAEFNANGSSFYTSHGTHVAGIIAGIGANKYGIKGVAPKVDLYAYRVLGAYGGGYTSWVIVAIDEAVKQGMDVINISLSGGSNTEVDAGAFAINNAMMAGVISVMSIGNSGPNRGTMRAPATAPLGIAVGNSTNPDVQHSAKINVTAGEYSYSKRANVMAKAFETNLSTPLKGKFQIVAVPGPGEQSDFDKVDVNGKVALISRGTIGFGDKIANAKKNGAIAAIIYNSVGTSPSNVVLGDSFKYLPTFDISLADGREIKSKIAAGGANVTFTNFSMEAIGGDAVFNTSSRGPSNPNFDIKPDVTAPGTKIMSARAMYKADFPKVSYDQAYDRRTGTSMAAPHIAGIAALIKQANPDWTPFDVKVALSNTAKVLDTTKYDVFSQGAGRVNAYAAAHPEILAYAIDEAVLNKNGKIVENLKGTVTFGPQDLSKSGIEVTKQILVKDIAGNGSSYDVSVKVIKGFGDAKVTVDNPSFHLNGEQTLDVTLTASQASTQPGDEIQGFIYIKKSGVEISLPFAADFSGTEQVESLKVEDVTLAVGEKKKLTVKHAVNGVESNATAAYTIANGEIATVSTEGEVTGISEGETTIAVSYRELKKTVAVKVTASPAPEPISVPVNLGFTDAKGHWAESYLQKAAALGIIKGYEDGTVKPNAALTRSQAVSMIVRALGLETNKQAPFTDISRYAAATQEEIAAAYYSGIIKENDGKFRPGNKVTRAQLALMLQRAYEVKTGKQYEPKKTAPFTDFGSYNQETIDAISMLYELQIVDGSNGKYMPSQATTRAHIAKMLINFLEQTE